MLATEGFIRDPRHEIDILVEEDDVDPMYEEIGDAIDVPVLIFRDGQVVYSGNKKFFSSNKVLNRRCTSQANDETNKW